MSRLIMLCGLPASGKSHYAKQLSKEYNAIIISSDELRIELFNDVNVQDRNNEVFNELKKRVKKALLENISVIIDSTNINYKRRKAFLDELKTYPIHKLCVFMATPYEECLRQNSLRERQIPEYVIKRMYKSIYIPQAYEGWDSIEIKWNMGDIVFSGQELFKDLKQINQDNPHHTLAIGEHCTKCAKVVMETQEDYSLGVAGLFHDIGKKFTKTFKNRKGETTDIAHYYQHHLVSAYLSLFYLKVESGISDEGILEIANYIQWHMQPFFIDSEKSKNRFINLVGQDFYDKLIILHEADVKAH